MFIERTYLIVHLTTAMVYHTAVFDVKEDSRGSVTSEI
jgi:hypothetical protein